MYAGLACHWYFWLSELYFAGLTGHDDAGRVCLAPNPLSRSTASGVWSTRSFPSHRSSMCQPPTIVLVSTATTSRPGSQDQHVPNSGLMDSTQTCQKCRACLSHLDGQVFFLAHPDRGHPARNTLQPQRNRASFLICMSSIISAEHIVDDKMAPKPINTFPHHPIPSSPPHSPLLGRQTNTTPPGQSTAPLGWASTTAEPHPLPPSNSQ